MRRFDPALRGAARADRRRRPRPRAHAPRRLARPRAAVGGVRRALGGDVPRPADPRLRHDPLGHGVGGEVGLRRGGRADDRLRRSLRRRRHLRPRARAHGRGVRARRGDARGRPRRGRPHRGDRLAGQRGRGDERTHAAPAARPDRRRAGLPARTPSAFDRFAAGYAAEMEHFLALAAGRAESAVPAARRAGTRCSLPSPPSGHGRPAAPVAVQHADELLSSGRGEYTGPDPVDAGPVACGPPRRYMSVSTAWSMRACSGGVRHSSAPSMQRWKWTSSRW